MYDQISMKKLDPKAVWLFFFSYFFLTLFACIFLIGFLILRFIQAVDTTDLTSYTNFLSYIGIWILGGIVLAVCFSYIWSRLTLHFYKYQLSENGFQKEHGVLWKKYVTIPYERIQNVDIYQGILARLLGLADLHIQTAGMSSTIGSYGGSSEGRLPGLLFEDAKKLRDEVIRRAKQSSKQGL